MVALALVAPLGCEFGIPAPTYIHQTKLISVPGEVVELGPLHPGRIGVPTGAPVAEALPEDRYAFDAVVVDTSGNVVPPEQLDSLWFQCDIYGCGAGYSFEQFDDDRYLRSCADLAELTLDEPCRLGGGDGHFEFEVSPLGPLVLGTRTASYYGVVGWNGRSAESCWEARRVLDGTELDDCGFIVRQVKIGPSWWLLAYAESLGFESPIPLWQIPAPVYEQAANRTPQPTLFVTVDGVVAGAWPDQSAFQVKRGGRIEIATVYDELERLTQLYFVAILDSSDDSYRFEPVLERIQTTPYTSEAIHTEESAALLAGTPLRFVVDEFGDVGESQIYVVYGDERYCEDVARLDFEVHE